MLMINRCPEQPVQQTTAGSRRTKVNLFARCCSSRSGHHETSATNVPKKMFVLLAGSAKLFRGFLSPATTNGHTTPWPGEVGLGQPRVRSRHNNHHPLTLSVGYA